MLEHYVAANSEASSRARGVFALLLLTSIVTAVGIRNSMASSWMRYRINELHDVGTPGRANACYVPNHRPKELTYWASVIGCAPTPAPKHATQQQKDEHDEDTKLYEERYQAVAVAAGATYADTRYFVHAPVIGVAVDVNDLGYFAGVGMVVLFIWLLFSLNTEERNLADAFAFADNRNELSQFYGLLAMHQVITAPQRPRHDVTLPAGSAWEGLVWSYEHLVMRFGREIGPKLLLMCPLGVYAWLTAHDVLTLPIVEELHTTAYSLIAFELVFCVWLAYLTGRSIRAFRRLDAIWNDYATRIRDRTPAAAARP